MDRHRCLPQVCLSIFTDKARIIGADNCVCREGVQLINEQLLGHAARHTLLLHCAGRHSADLAQSAVSIFDMEVSFTVPAVADFIYVSAARGHLLLKGYTLSTFFQTSSAHIIRT